MNTSIAAYVISFSFDAFIRYSSAYIATCSRLHVPVDLHVPYNHGTGCLLLVEAIH